MEFIKDRLKEIRLEHGLTQSDVAQRMNRSQSTYGKLETGNTIVSFNDVEKFAKALNMSIVDVITWPEKWVNGKEYRKGKDISLVEESYQRCLLCDEKERTIKYLEKYLLELEISLGKCRKTGSE